MSRRAWVAGGVFLLDVVLLSGSWQRSAAGDGPSTSAGESGGSPRDSVAAADHPVFDECVVFQHDETRITLRLTGTATRKLLTAAMYDIASYCEYDREIDTPSKLIETQKVRELRLRMRRPLSSRTVQTAIIKLIDDTAEEGEFDEEKQILSQHLAQRRFRTNDVIALGLSAGGLVCRINDEEPIRMPDTQSFARAIWQGYIGDPNYLGPRMRADLTRLLATWPQRETSAGRQLPHR
jgi:hypothetical protein